MSSLLALLSAATFGAGDFFGGLATRKSGPSTTVVLNAHVVGLVFLVVIAPVFGFNAALSDMAWGVAGGIAGAVGLVLLYRGLAIGTMSIVAPITAIGAAVVPVTWALVRGERPETLAIVGAVISLLAIYLVSQPAADEPSGGGNSGLAEAIGAGFGFGGFFIILAETSADSGLVPLVFARLGSIAVLLVLSLVLGRRLMVASSAFWLTVGAGVFDSGANALFLAAARTGLLTLVAVLSALYPISTILLARIVLKERIGRVQQLGLVVGLVGIVLIAATG